MTAEFYLNGGCEPADVVGGCVQFFQEGGFG